VLAFSSLLTPDAIILEKCKISFQNFIFCFQLWGNGFIGAVLWIRIRNCMDPHQSDKLDPDPHQSDADPQNCIGD
jgi:hypothetical protein